MRTLFEESATLSIRKHLALLAAFLFFSTGILLTQQFQEALNLREPLTEKQMQSILKNVPIGIGVEENRVFIQVNDYVLKLTGYTQEEFIGQSARMLYPSQEEFDDTGAELYRQLAEKGVGSVETRWMAKDGSIRHVLLSSSPLDSADLSEGITFTVLDISENKLAEERFTRMFRSNPASMAISILPMRYFTDVNEAFLKTLGYSWEEVIGKTSEELGLFFDKEEQESLAAKLAVDGSIRDFELQVRRRDGAVLTGLFSGEIIQDQKDFYFLTVMIDVTEAKRIEKALQTQTRRFLIGLTALIFALLLLVARLAIILRQRKAAGESLRESEENFRFLVNYSYDLIWKLSSAGVLLYVSSSWKVILGYEPARMIDERFHTIVHPDDILDCEKYMSEVLESKKAQPGHQYRVKHANGTWRWHEGSMTPVFTDAGSFLYFVGVSRDITDRKQAEKQLREDEAKYRSIIESSPVGYHIYDLQEDGRLVFNMYNRSADNILHTEHERFMGLDILLAFPALAGTGVPEMYRAVARGELETQNFEVSYDHGGIHGVYEVRVFRGAPDQAVVNFVDISERKLAEDAIKQAQKIVAEKNKELEQIVYVTSHDLRSPLVNVEGFSRELEYALMRINSALEPGDKNPVEIVERVNMEFHEMEQSLKHIRNSARQMDNLLKGLLKLSRSGRAALHIQPLNMGELIGQVCASFAYRLQETGSELIVEKLPDCMGDSVQVTQVFSNLIENALKYRDPNRVGKVRLFGTIESNRAVYRVEDNGIGIAENHQEVIFELFHRLNPKDSEGEGLGLTIARQIVGRMDGELLVESKPGVGSVFIVRLPKAEERKSIVGKGTSL